MRTMRLVLSLLGSAVLTCFAQATEGVAALPKATVTQCAPLTLTQADHSYMCWPSGDATVDRPLQIVMNFKAQETLAEAQAGAYGKYKCDFYLTIEGLAEDSITANDCYLAGNYGSFGWIVIPTDGMVLEEGVTYPIVSAYDANLTYENICDYVKDFTAAIYVAPAILKANPDFKVTLDLRMTNPNDETNVLTIGEPATYTVKDLLMPTATVTELDNEDLTFALNFKADTVSSEALEYFGSWYADFVLTVNKETTFNANGGVNGYLSGQYDAWSENWLNVPFEDVTLQASESLKIMEYAAKMMGQSGLKVTYRDVYEGVKDFDCGVFFEPAFLAANPDLEVTLELRMYNPADESESYVIGKTYEFKVGEKPTVTIPEDVTAPEGVQNNAAVENTPVVLPADVKTFEISLAKVDTEATETTKVTFNVEPKNAEGTKVATPSKAITFRLPLPTAWTGFAKVTHEEDVIGVYEIQEEDGAKFVEITSQAFSTYAVEQSDVVLPAGVTTASFGTNTVTDGTTYYATLQAATEAVCGTAGATLYCKPGADVGSLQHAPVTATLTIYGNGAYVSGGAERDFDIGNTDPSGGKDIAADMTLTVKDLDGCGAWGTKATTHTVNLVFEDCQNMGKVFITGTTGTLNITIKDSSFEGVIKEAVYSNADGAITISNVDFSNLNKAINLNHKAAGTQTVTIQNSTFTNCGADVSADQIPVRILSSVEGGKSVLTVSGTTFSGTPEGGADILLDYGVGETTANVSTAGTAANVVVEKTNNVGTTTVIPANTSNQTFATVQPVAKIGTTEYTTFAAAITAANSMTGDVTIEIYGKVETTGVGLTGAYDSITFVGKTDDAEICINGIGYFDARSNDSNVNFKDLTLRKINGSYAIDGRLNEYFSTYSAGIVTYTNCTFPTGVCALGSGDGKTVKFSGCNFNNTTSGQYSLWIDGNATNCVVEDSEFNGVRGIKLYAENGAKFSEVTVTGTTFSSTITEKHAVVLTRGESVELTGNTYNNTKGTVEVDDDYASEIEGKSVVIEETEYIVDSDNRTLVEPDPAAKIGETGYATLQEALDAAVDGDTVVLQADITEDVLFVQKTAVDVIVDGNGKTLTGTFAIHGGKAYDAANPATETLLIQNVIFQSKPYDATTKTPDAIIYTRDRSSASAYSYSHNVTIDGCTFKGVDANTRNSVAAIRHKDGGDWNWVVKNCTANDNLLHSLLQVNNVGGDKGIVVDNCTVQTKNGMNINYTHKIEVTNSTIAVDGYVLRAGVKNSDEVAESFTFTNNVLSSAATSGDDAIITLRGTGAVKATINMEKNVATTGNVHIYGTTEDTVIHADANYWGDGKTGPDVNGSATVEVESYYKDATLTQLVLAKPAAKIGETGYATLAEAVEAAQAGETIVVQADIALTDTLTIPVGKTITLDLNGKTISQTKAQTGNYQMILNDGNLTIQDSVGGGKISYTDTVGGNFISNTITNRGTLTLKSGTIENLSSQAVADAGFPYAIDTSIWGAATEVNTIIEGGTVTCANYSALRLRADSETEAVNITITGGTVNGRIEVQNPSSTKTTVGALSITGGAINKNNSSKAIMIFGGGGTGEKLDVAISGGTVTGEIGYSNSFPISNFDEGIISGGTFTTDVSDFCADGYEVKQNADGTYGVQASLTGSGTEADPYVIGTLDELKLFASKVNGGNAFDNQFIKLTDDIDLGSVVWTPIGNATTKFLGTFDGNGKTISNLIVDIGANNAGLFGYASVIKNLTVNNAKVKGLVSVGAMVGELENSVGTLDNCHVTGRIEVTGENSVGGLAGKGYANIKNCSVIGDGVATSFVLGVYGSTEEGDNIGGLIGHLGEGNTLGVANSTVKNIKVAGTRKIGGLVGTTARGNDYVGNTVENVIVESTATAEYADDNASTCTIGGIIGNYFGSATSGGILNNSTVKNVTFVLGNAKSAGALVGGDRNNNGGAPVGVEASGSVVENVTGTTVSHFLVAQIGNVAYETFEAALAAAQAGDTIVLMQDVTCAEKPVFNKGGIVNVDVNGHTFVSTEKARVRNVASADGAVASNNIKFVSGFGWEVYQYNNMPANNVEFRVFPTLEAAVTYNPSTNNPARIYPYQNVTQEADVILKAYPAGTSSTICVDPGYEIVWDLNGYTVTQESPTGNPLEACIRGTFTLKDSSSAQTGKWIAGACGVTDSSNGWYGNGGPALYVLGDGKVVLEGGTISIARNVDKNGNELDVVNTGGLIRLDDGELIVKEGATLTVEDTYGIMAWGGEIVVNGGTFDIDPTVSTPIYAVGYYTDAAVEVNAPFDGALCVYGNVSGYKGASATVTVPNIVYATGGAFVTPTVAEGLMAFDGVVLEAGEAVVTTETTITSYATLAAAFTAAQPGDTVTIMSGTYNQGLTVDKAITVVGATDAEGNNLVTFNGTLNVTADGATVRNINVNNPSGNGGTINAKNVLIEGCSVVGKNGFRYCYTTGTVTFKDSVITGQTYGIHFDGYAGGDIIIDNCVITGWTSFAGTITNVAIEDTTFANGNYNQLRFYQNAQMTNVKFNEDMTIDFGKEDVDAVFTGCTVVDSEGNPSTKPLTDVIYKGDIADMGIDVTIDTKPMTVEAKIGEVYYLTLQDALNAAAKGTGEVTVDVLTDIDMTGKTWTPVQVSAPGYPLVTVNGNNKTIKGLTDMLFSGTWAGKSGLVINDLTIADSTIVNDENDDKGTVGVGAFIGYPSASETITLKNCHLKNSTVKGGHWTGGLVGIAGGYSGNDGPVFMTLTFDGCSVTGSTITGKGSAGGIIGHAANDAWTNVIIKDATVSDNSITSTGSSANKAGSVMGTIGAAGQSATAGGETMQGGVAVAATTSGNTVVSATTTITTIYGRQGSATGMLEVTGGTYEANPIEENVAYAAPTEGYIINQNTDGTYGVVVDPAYGKIAKAGDGYYDTLVAAVAAATPGQTVTLLTDASGNGIIIDKSITIDLNEKTYTIDGTLVGSSGTKSCGFQILSGNTVTIKQGAIVIDEAAVRGHDNQTGNNFAIQNYANLTLEDVAVTGNTKTSYVVSINSGTVALTGTTAITSQKDGGIAFDVCKYADYAEPSVTLNTSGTITGKVEVTGGTFTHTAGTITGGVVTDATHVLVQNGNVYTVRDKAYVAQVGTEKYESVAAALEAAQPGDTVTLLADVTMSEILVINKAITLDGNGKKLTYTGTNRAIEIPMEANGANVTIKNLTVDASSAERGINYNTNGTLTVEKVTVTSKSYAINFPTYADNATVSITNSKLTSAIALNIWGSDMDITVTDSELYSVENDPNFSYGAIQLNSDEANGHIANGTTVTVNGGKISATDEEGEIGLAVSNWTATGEVAISDTTVVSGEIKYVVATYGGAGAYTLQHAIDEVIRMGYTCPILIIRDIELTASVTIPAGANITIDLNGKKLTGPDVPATKSYYAFIVDGGDLTLKDSVGTGEIWAKCYGVETKSGSFTMESGTITATNNKTLGSAVVNYGGTVTIK
ncbi:MAG: hypothetical protein IJV69_08510, partial [Kiritimatiellae bacterium]|nr:hypothetical protein [Kiritimatiellia bacterium]